MVRAAQERLRRGEAVAPWELVPVSHTFLKGWRLLEEAVAPKSVGWGYGKTVPYLGAGRVEAYRDPAFRPLPRTHLVEWEEGKPEKFYVAPASYPMVEPGFIGYHSGFHDQGDEQRAHTEAVAKWRDLGAIVVKLDFSRQIESHLADGHGAQAHRDSITPDGLCDYCRWIEAYSWRVLTKEPDIRRAGQKAGWHGGHGGEDVILPAQWDWARIMRKQKGRWKNPADPRRRRAERGPLDRGGIMRLLQERLRSGIVTREGLEWAKAFSSPWTDEYDLRPFSTGRNAEILQFDPKVFEIFMALDAMGVKAPRQGEAPSIGSLGSQKLGGYEPFSTTLYPDPHLGEGPPYRLGPLEAHEDVDALFAAEEAWDRIYEGYFRKGPDWEIGRLPDPAFGHVRADGLVSWWHLREHAFKHETWALKLLAWLRENSAVEYMSVLGGWDVAAAWPPPDAYPRWQQVELELIRSFLGGPPL